MNNLTKILSDTLLFINMVTLAGIAALAIYQYFNSNNWSIIIITLASFFIAYGVKSFFNDVFRK